ncbi:MAG: hypothetical protein LBT37_00995 [Lactobacillaceae bacterium]|jgi:tetratricopeptide (TPR) repeat protein|nr:hypothetical protein [Lactobacillaceae bacterium]
MVDENLAQNDIKALVTAIEQDADNWRAYVDLVNVLAATENLIEAEELALKSLNLFEQNDEAHEHLLYATGNVYYLAGDFNNANRFFKEVTNHHLQHDATMMQAQSWYNQKNFNQALVYGLTGVEQVPKDEAAQIMLGNIWLSLNDLEHAKGAFNQALVVNEKNFDANFGRGLIAAVEGQLENEWLDNAKEINHEKYQQQAQQLDDLTQLLNGRIDE